MAQGFKTLIFLTIPLSVFVVILVCTSFATQFWVVGTAGNGSNTLEFNFGLFSGFKTRIFKGVTFASDLRSKAYFCHPLLFVPTL